MKPMKKTLTHIPYMHRCWKSGSSQFFYIAPFADAAPKSPLVELILDNNAFIESTISTKALLGAQCIPGLMGFGINPYFAITEQWLSNPAFWSNRLAIQEPPKSELISDFLKTTGKLGIAFAEDYAATMIADMRLKDAALRENLGILFAYLAVIRALQRKKAPLEDKLARLKSFTANDIPKFNGLIGLAILTFYFQANRMAKDEDGKQVISFLDSFFSPGEGEPPVITAAYLRNRAADLWLWYSMPQLYSSPIQPGFNPQPTQIVVTADKFLAAIPFRFIPPRLIKTGVDERLEFHFSPDGVASEHQEKLMDLFASAHEPTSAKPSAHEQMRKIQNLYHQSWGTLDRADQPGFESAWQQWVNPAQAS